MPWQTAATILPASAASARSFCEASLLVRSYNAGEDYEAVLVIDSMHKWHRVKRVNKVAKMNEK